MPSKPVAASKPQIAPAPRPLGFGRMLLLIAAIAFLSIIAISLLAPAIGASGAQCIGRVRIYGEITYEGTGGVFGGGLPPAEEIAMQIRQADRDERVGAILLDIDSPGGTPVASKELFDAVRSAKKPVVSYFAETAASGAYYVGAASDHVIANPNTLTGSIGARLTLLNYEGLFEKLGLREESVQSGALKDIGASYRNATPLERELLGRLINETASNFITDVREGRKGKLTPLFEELLDARVVGAKDALRAGLIDEIGGISDAKRKAAELAKIDLNGSPLDDIEYCEYQKRRSLWDALAGMSSDLGASFARGFRSELAKTQSVIQYR
ncbi:MAG: signal peptide peptidase SppA [Candidatus Micrarchaeota archaeon]